MLTIGQVYEWTREHYPAHGPVVLRYLELDIHIHPEKERVDDQTNPIDDDQIHVPVLEAIR